MATINQFRISFETNKKFEEILEIKQNKLKNSKDPLERKQKVKKNELAAQMFEYGVEQYLKATKNKD